jgi:hypothetical protein
MAEPWLVGIVVTVLLTIIGWLLAERGTRNKLIDTQRETIRMYERQIDRMEITAKLTDMVVSQQLPQQRAPGSTQ